jgi:hypothetical protein
MSSKINFQNGEGIRPGDFNDQRDLMLRYLFDHIAMNQAAPDQALWAGTQGGRQVESLRPLRGAGAFTYVLNGTTVDVNGGLWIQADFGQALDADGPIAKVAHKDAETLTGFVAASAGQFRRDIIQARITEVNEAGVSRDFKDAVTGALTTNPATVKRSNYVVEYARKAGVEGNDAFQLDPANEVAPDAGWFTIGSVKCYDGGLAGFNSFGDPWDWRKPWGYSRAISGAGDFYWGSAETFGVSNHSVLGDASGVVYADCPLSASLMGMADYDTIQSHVRLERIKLYSFYNGAPPLNDIHVYAIDGSNFHTNSQQLGTNGSAGGSSDTIFVDGGPLPPEKLPLWSNGFTHPGINSGIDSGMQGCGIFARTANVADWFSSVLWEAWGGF